MLLSIHNKLILSDKKVLTILTCSGAPCMSLGHLFEARATPSWMSKISFPGTAGIEVHCFLQTKYVANSLQTWLVDLFVDIFLINFIGQDDQLLLGSKIDQHDLTWFATLQLSLAKEGSKKSQYGRKTERDPLLSSLKSACLCPFLPPFPTFPGLSEFKIFL